MVTTKKDRVVLHVDLNNFYASVECLYHPALRGRPVAVGGDEEKRHGIVLAKNDLAKARGVRTGHALWQARKLCPDIVFVPPDYGKYLRYSALAKRIYQDFTGAVESYGLDECWLDVTGSVACLEEGEAMADEIRNRIRFELGVTCSVGVSFNKIFAKLGSDMKKPDATTVIPREEFREVVWPLPVEELLFVGRATLEKLLRARVRTIGDLAQADVADLEKRLGKNGRTLWLFANGMDTSPVAQMGEEAVVKSIGNSTTAPRDLVTDRDLRITLRILSESVAQRLRQARFQCRTVHLSLRDTSLTWIQRQETLQAPTNCSDHIYQAAYRLYKRHGVGIPLRSVGVRGCNLAPYDGDQLTFWPDKKQELEKAIDSVRSRFGHFALQRAVMLTDPVLSDLNPVDDHVIHPEPFGR